MPTIRLLLKLCFVSMIASCGDDAPDLRDAAVGPDAETDAGEVLPAERRPRPDPGAVNPPPGDPKPAIDPVCEQVCGAIAALPCAEGERTECVSRCEAAHRERCGDLIREMQLCLVSLGDGWRCVDGVTIKRAVCPREVDAVERCLVGAGARPTVTIAPNPDVNPPASAASSASSAADDAGVVGDSLSDAASGMSPSDDAGTVAEPLPMPTASARCAAYCDAQLAVPCLVKPLRSDCLALCAIDEAGPCGAAAGALHQCDIDAPDAWQCVDAMAIGMAENVCADEALSWAVCLVSS